MKGEVVTEVLKASPPLTMVSLTFLGYPLSDWVQLAVLLYTLLQMHVLANKNVTWYKSLVKWLTRGGKNVADSKGK